MTQDNYLDLKAMQERVDAERKEFFAEQSKRQEVERQRAIKERESNNELFAKAMLSEREDNERKRAIEIEKEKQKAIQDVENKFESKGVKSDKTKAIDNSFKEMITGFTFED